MRTLVAVSFALVMVALAGARPSSGPQSGGATPLAAVVPRSAQVLDGVSALPAAIVALFQEPAAFARTPAGNYLVFDRRGQAVFSVDPGRTRATRIVEVGAERGRIIRPSAFAMAADGSFAITDSPDDRERVQRFAERGYFLGGFLLSPRPGPRMMVDRYVAGGVPSLEYTGDWIYISEPWTGALVTEYAWNGETRRSFGRLRPTPGETDRDVQLALNAGVPVVDPTGGFYFVFQTGVPIFRKYDRAGTLVFERHIEGRELDDVLKTQPERWPKRVDARRREYPAVPLVVRTAAVDTAGRLWVALDQPIVYVYSPDGDKIRTIQLRGKEPVAPLSLFFARAGRLLVVPGCYEFPDIAPRPPH